MQQTLLFAAAFGAKPDAPPNIGAHLHLHFACPATDLQFIFGALLSFLLPSHYNSSIDWMMLVFLWSHPE